MNQESRSGRSLEVFVAYRHFFALAAAIVLLVTILPAPEGSLDASTSGVGTGRGRTASGAADGATDVDAESEGVGAAGGRRGSGAAGGGGGVAGSRLPLPEGVELVANCDRETGRVRVPTLNAAPCVAAYNGANGGTTSPGVTGDAIRVVFYRVPASEATTAALTAAGAANSWEDSAATFQAYVDMFSAHYELYGRKIELHFKEPSGADDDDAAAQADAIDIATRIKPFIVTATGGGGPLNAFSETLASRGIICICGISQPQEFYQGMDPYLGYTTLMASSQGYVHRSEYICKRLGKDLAEHAGYRDTPTDPMSDEKRTYAILYYETEDRAYKAGVDEFEVLLSRCGIKLKTRVEFVLDLATLQQEAVAMISRMKSDGVTSVIFSGDPISPAVFTAEATRQNWYPEWIVTGSALTDTNLFARTYDQQQWANAFGISYLAALYEPTEADSFKLHAWHFGTGPQADNVHPVIYAVAWPLFTGIHLAGPNLTPQTWQAGLFSYPPTGGGATQPHISYGDHGIWGSTDYLANDDITEVWWDPNAVGPDQLGNQGKGMYRYANNGLRYMPGEQPTSKALAFVTQNAPAFFDTRPESDVGPSYPRPGS